MSIILAPILESLHDAGLTLQGGQVIIIIVTITIITVITTTTTTTTITIIIIIIIHSPPVVLESLRDAGLTLQGG